MRIFTLLFILLLGITGCDQVTNISSVDVQGQAALPPFVLNEIAKKYPDAQQVLIRTLENNALWQADFQTKSDFMVLAINQEGQFISEMAATSLGLLPNMAQKTIQAKQNKFGGIQAFRVLEKGQVISYKAEWNVDNNVQSLIFDLSGTLLYETALPALSTNLMNTLPAERASVINGNTVFSDAKHIAFVPQSSALVAISSASLPAEIKRYVQEKESDAKFKLAFIKIESGTKFYEVVLEKQGKLITFKFDALFNKLN